MESDDEDSKPLANIIIKELRKNNSLTSPDKLNATAKNNIMVKEQINSLKLNQINC